MLRIRFQKALKRACAKSDFTRPAKLSNMRFHLKQFVRIYINNGCGSHLCHRWQEIMLVNQRVSMQEIARLKNPDEIPKSQKTDMGWIVVIVDAARRRMSDHDVQNTASLDPLP